MFLLVWYQIFVQKYFETTLILNLFYFLRYKCSLADFEPQFFSSMNSSILMKDRINMPERVGATMKISVIFDSNSK